MINQMTQMKFDFEATEARKSDPITSKKAARNVKTNSIRASILGVLAKKGLSLTSLEISEEIGVPRDYVSPHLSKLKRLGYVRENGTKINHTSGQMAIAWKIPDNRIEEFKTLKSTYNPKRCYYCGGLLKI